MDLTIRLTLTHVDGPRRTRQAVADALADLIGQQTVYVEGAREASTYEVDGDVDVTTTT